MWGWLDFFFKNGIYLLIGKWKVDTNCFLCIYQFASSIHSGNQICRTYRYMHLHYLTSHFAMSCTSVFFYFSKPINHMSLLFWRVTVPAPWKKNYDGTNTANSRILTSHMRNNVVAEFSGKSKNPCSQEGGGGSTKGAHNFPKKIFPSALYFVLLFRVPTPFSLYRMHEKRKILKSLSREWRFVGKGVLWEKCRREHELAKKVINVLTSYDNALKRLKRGI